MVPGTRKTDPEKSAWFLTTYYDNRAYFHASAGGLRITAGPAPAPRNPSLLQLDQVGQTGRVYPSSSETAIHLLTSTAADTPVIGRVTLFGWGAGLKADRCWGSNGQARSMPEDVDIIIADGLVNLQAKRARKIAGYLKPWDYSEAVTGVVTRGDRDPDNVVAITLTHYLALVKRVLEFDGELPD